MLKTVGFVCVYFLHKLKSFWKISWGFKQLTASFIHSSLVVTSLNRPYYKTRWRMVDVFAVLYFRNQACYDNLTTDFGVISIVLSN